MANFKTHFTVGIISSVIISYNSFTMLYVNKQQTVFLFILGVIASLSPDIDSKNSISKRIIFNIFSSATCLLILFEIYADFGIILSMIVIILCYILLNKFLLPYINKMCVHRGIIHSIPMAIFLGLIIYNITFSIYSSKNMALSFGMTFILCFLVHLILDELYSVDLKNNKIKKSFGTALTVIKFKKPDIAYYILLMTFIVIIYNFSNLSYQDIYKFLTKQGQEFVNNLLPSCKYLESFMKCPII